jgi:hypothetical protein
MIYRISRKKKKKVRTQRERTIHPKKKKKKRKRKAPLVILFPFPFLHPLSWHALTMQVFGQRVEKIRPFFKMGQPF